MKNPYLVNKLLLTKPFTKWGYNVLESTLCADSVYGEELRTENPRVEYRDGKRDDTDGRMMEGHTDFSWGNIIVEIQGQEQVLNA